MVASPASVSVQPERISTPSTTTSGVRPGESTTPTMRWGRGGGGALDCSTDGLGLLEVVAFTYHSRPVFHSPKKDNVQISGYLFQIASLEIRRVDAPLQRHGPLPPGRGH